MKNKKNYIMLSILFAAIAGFSLAPSYAMDDTVGGTLANDPYTKYKGSFSLGYWDTWYEDKYYKQERRWGITGRYQAMDMLSTYKMGGKTEKESCIEIYEAYEYKSRNSEFKAVVEYRYWDGSKFIDKYSTKTLYKQKGESEVEYCANDNWVPMTVKIYTKP